MTNSQDLTALLEGRGNLYRLLSRLYIVEVDAAFLAALRSMTFPAGADEPRMAEGWQRLAKCLAGGDLGADPVETLAVDYARIFLSAGVTSGAAYPIESVYTSPEHLVMQDAWEAVCKAYREAGFEKDPKVDAHEDQLGLEFAFLAHLNDRMIDAVKIGDDAAYRRELAASKRFLTEHPMRWVADFARDVRKCPATDFYPAVSLVTEGFIAMDAALLEDLEKDAKAGAAA